MCENKIEVKSKGRRPKRPVAQLDKNGNLIKIWESQYQAGKYFDNTNRSIWWCVHKIRKSAYGCLWVYADELSGYNK